MMMVSTVRHVSICELTKDAYGTGDSPTMRECTANDPTECPGLMS